MNTMQNAFAEVGIKQKRDPVSPWNPSRRAIKRVANPLPVPTICPHCGSAVKIVNHEEIYNGQSYGEWPWAYKCDGNFCDAYVGMHPFTNIPLGTLATHAMRDARKRAKAVFQPLWQSGEMTRSEAYAWLAVQLGIAVAATHIGWFDVPMCNRVVEVLRARNDAHCEQLLRTAAPVIGQPSRPRETREYRARPRARSRSRTNQIIPARSRLKNTSAAPP